MKNCLLCDALLASVPSWQSLFNPVDDKIICDSCSKSFKRADTIDKTPYLSSIVSLYTYNEAMKNYVHQFKFNQDIALAAVFRQDLQVALKHHQNIVPIPVHPDRKLARTFSQVEALLDYARIPYANPLAKQNETVMGEKTREERMNVSQLFQVNSYSAIQPVTYTLVDDIYTTGTTLNHAAKVLREAGATDVIAVTLIRA